MSEYIKKVDALEIVKRTSGDYAAAFVEIKRLPKADVAPVVHGKWLYKKEWGRLITNECSICKQILTTQNGESMNYCPHCGAKMDLE